MGRISQSQRFPQGAGWSEPHVELLTLGFLQQEGELPECLASFQESWRAAGTDSACQAGETRGGVAVCRSQGQTPADHGAPPGRRDPADSPGARMLAAAPVGDLCCQVGTSAGQHRMGALLLASDASGLASTSCLHPSSPAHHWLGTTGLGSWPCPQQVQGPAPATRGQRQPWGLPLAPHAAALGPL